MMTMNTPFFPTSAYEVQCGRNTYLVHQANKSGDRQVQGHNLRHNATSIGSGDKSFKGEIFMTDPVVAIPGKYLVWTSRGRLYVSRDRITCVNELK